MTLNGAAEADLLIGVYIPFGSDDLSYSVRLTALGEECYYCRWSFAYAEP